MKQSRTASLTESIINIAVGFGISLAAQAIILPLIGVQISLQQNLLFAAIMTAVSIARSYALRRLFEALHIRVPLSPFMLAVIAERRRQVEVEGWTAEHDQSHRPGELAQAGAAYALYDNGGMGKTAEQLWPWSKEWWKPTGIRRDLVKGAALIVAEGERFDRNRLPRGDWDNPRPRGHARPSARLAHPTASALAHGKTPSEHGGCSA